MKLHIIDGLRNIVAGLGTPRDKSSHSYYADSVLQDDQLVTMYRSSAIARKIIDLPAEDSLREWREWQADAETISKIEAEEKRLGLQGAMIKASKRARLFGGCAIFIGTGDEDLMEPLKPEHIGLGGLKYLTVLARTDLVAGDIERDPRAPFYGKPKYYQMMCAETGQMAIHPSRLVITMGDELPDERYAGNQLGWSDPVLNSVLTEVTNMDATAANVASLVFEAKIDVIGVNGFNEGLRSGGTAYENMMLARATLTATGKGINGTVLIDKEDSYTQKSASFATLPDIMDRFMQMTSAAASIPMTLLFGMSPGGLNASGDADTRGYYDRVKAMQTLELQPAMAVLDECLLYSALGKRPAEIFYSWRPLWQPTTKERAETGKIIAETFVAISGLDLLPPEALGKAIVNGLTESGLAPGLEADVAEYFEGGVPDNEEVEEI